jgi:hypothetical protein
MRIKISKCWQDNAKYCILHPFFPFTGEKETITNKMATQEYVYVLFIIYELLICI